MKYLKLLPILLLFACQSNDLSENTDRVVLQAAKDLRAIDSQYQANIDSLRKEAKSR